MKKIIGFLFAALSFTAFAAGIDPQASALMDKMEKVYDPSGKNKQLKTRITEAEMTMVAQNIKMNLVTYFKVPYMLRVDVTVPGMMDVATGFDGKTAWEFNKASGVREMTGKELASFKFGAMLEAPLTKLQDLCSDITYDKNGGFVDGIPCIKMVCTPKPEFNCSVFTVWVSLKDCYMRKLEMINVTQMGDIPATTLFRDFRTVDGRVIPYEQEISQLTMKMTLVIKKVTYNTDISDSKFKMPEDAGGPSVPMPALPAAK